MKQRSLLQQYFGFDDFRSGQQQAVEHILQGRNTLVIMPTGAGKSLIYQYSALVLHEQGRSQAGAQAAVTLVISPLIALMKDQVDSLQARGIAATYINSTLSAAEQLQRSAAMQQGNYRLVYVAPERLRQSSFVRALKNIDIQLLAIDEAHCISSWGHDFRPDYRRIAAVRRELGQPLTVALTATATTLVQDDIVGLLDMNEAPRVVTGFNRPNLSFEVLYTGARQAKLQELAQLLREQLASQGNGDEPGDAQILKTETKTLGACIVYVATRKEAEDVSAFVGQHLGFPCGYYHAGMAVPQREQIQNAFSSGKLAIVVATNAFGMGIDRQDVRLVVHHNMPGTLEAYYQEAGRAGRDGLPSRAVLLFSPQDRSLQAFFIQRDSITAQQLHQVFQKLESLPPEAGGTVRLCRPQELGRSLGWDQQKLRLALSHLEKSGILENAEFALVGGEEASALRLELGSWNDASVAQSTRQIEEHIEHRKSQLEQMSHYAQAAACRRNILLSYFSDEGSNLELTARQCCDYCGRQQQRHRLGKQGGEQGLETGIGGGADVPKQLSQLSRPQRAALIILDSVRQLREVGITVGRRRIAQFLTGSRSQKMDSRFCSHRYYGRLAALFIEQIESAISELLQLGYLCHQSIENSRASVIALAEQGREALAQREAIELLTFRDIDSVSGQARGWHPPPVSRGGLLVKASTTAQTLELLKQGLSLDQVAEQRHLSAKTIGSHVGTLIEQGELELEDYVSAKVRSTVEQCLQQLHESGADFGRLRPIKDLLPPEISYNELKFVLEAWQRQHKCGPAL